MKKTIILILALTLLSSVFAYGDINKVYRQGFVEGYLIENIDGRLEIESYEGDFYSLAIADDAMYTIDSYIVDKSNFMPGMEVYAEIQGRRVVSVEGYSTSSLGYIPAGSKIRTGRISRIDRNQLVLQLGNGQVESYFTSPATIALKNGNNVALTTLYEGDKVKLYFDEIDTNMINRISIEGDSVRIKGLYKGELSLIDTYSDRITISNLEQISNGTWKDVTQSMTIPYNKDFPLYIGGYEIPYDNLKYYRGKTVYLANKDYFGNDRIERMLVQNQYESTYSDKIEDINWFTNSFELSNNRNINFDEGTIVIKNDRIVDTYALNPNSDVFVVADGRGMDSSAGIIYVLNEDINNSNIGQHYIYAGRMDKILEDKLELKDFFILEENEWQSFDDKKDLFFDNDTDIYDITNGKKLSIKEFYSGNYAVDEDSRYAKRNNLKDWHGYIYTDGDRISSIMVQKKMDSLLRQRVTNGQIATTPIEDNLVGWKTEITNARDWSNRSSQWMEKNTNLNINLEEALLIKEGKQIEPYQLKVGDRVYLVRDDFYSKILIVK